MSQVYGQVDAGRDSALVKLNATLSMSTRGIASSRAESQRLIQRSRAKTNVELQDTRARSRAAIKKMHRESESKLKALLGHSRNAHDKFSHHLTSEIGELKEV